VETAVVFGGTGPSLPKRGNGSSDLGAPGLNSRRKEDAGKGTFSSDLSERSENREPVPKPQGGRGKNSITVLYKKLVSQACRDAKLERTETERTARVKGRGEKIQSRSKELKKVSTRDPLEGRVLYRR